MLLKDKLSKNLDHVLFNSAQIYLMKIHSSFFFALSYHVNSLHHW